MSELSTCCERTFRTVYFGTCKECGKKTCVDCKTGLEEQTIVIKTNKLIGRKVYSLCKVCAKKRKI
jgi:phosphoribosyl 1,2-cyclic phosphodiesterase